MSTRIAVSKLTMTDARPKETAPAVGCFAACAFSLVVCLPLRIFLCCKHKRTISIILFCCDMNDSLLGARGLRSEHSGRECQQMSRWQCLSRDDVTRFGLLCVLCEKAPDRTAALPSPAQRHPHVEIEIIIVCSLSLRRPVPLRNAVSVAVSLFIFATLSYRGSLSCCKGLN